LRASKPKGMVMPISYVLGRETLTRPASIRNLEPLARQNENCCIPLKSQDRREHFFLDVNRGRLNVRKGSYQRGDDAPCTPAQ
jgi:hypothetical protein